MIWNISGIVVLISTLSFRRCSRILSFGEFNKFFSKQDAIANKQKEKETSRLVCRSLWVHEQARRIHQRVESIYVEHIHKKDEDMNQMLFCLFCVWQEYIQVDSFGPCGNLSCPETNGSPGEALQPCLDMLADNYKFVLAFERFICDDFVTKRFFDLLSRDTVPIVFG